MEILLQKNQELEKQLVDAMKQCIKVGDVPDNDNKNNVGGMLSLLLDCARQNSGKLPQGWRYDNVMKELGTMLFIMAGRYLYTFLVANLPLPSVTTVSRVVGCTEKIGEGIFRFKELKEFLVKRNFPLRVTISCDATVVSGRIQYDPHTNNIVGFPLPLDKNGMPIPNSFPAVSAGKIEEFFTTQKAAKDVYCFMAQPLAVSAPSFCLAIFGTNHQFDAVQCKKRWDFVRKELEKEGVEAFVVAGDGDSKQLKAMMATTFASDSSNWPWFSACLGHHSKTYFCFQDIIHILVKLKSRFLKPSIILPFGKQLIASRGHIVELIKTCSKDLHQLAPSILQPKDKMNYRAAEKLCSDKVSSLLKKEIAGSEATAVYLDMMRELTSAYLESSLSPLQRIEMVWKWVFVLRNWRRWIKEEKVYSLSNNFITSNAYSCIELNAHSLIQVIQVLRDAEEPELFLPWLYTSQPCEEIFRKLRSASTFLSNVTTFSLLDVQHKVRRLDILSELQVKLGKTVNVPKSKKAAKKQEECATNFILPEDYEIELKVQESYRKAFEICKKLGLHPPSRAPASALNLDEFLVEDHNDEDEDNLVVEVEEACSTVSPSPADEDTDDTLDVLEDLCVSTGNIELNTFNNVNLTPTCPFVKVCDTQGLTRIIRKSSLVWLLSSGDTKLSSDRLQRVRAAQVKHCPAWSSASPHSIPSKEDKVSIGNWCAFKEEEKIYIGRIVAFSYMSGSTLKEKEYSADDVTTSAPKSGARGIGCLCSWFTIRKNVLKPVNMDVHGYFNIEFYVCTVPRPQINEQGQLVVTYSNASLLNLC